MVRIICVVVLFCWFKIVCNSCNYVSDFCLVVEVMICFKVFCNRCWEFE